MQDNQVENGTKPLSAAQRIAAKVRSKLIKTVYLPSLDETITYKNDPIAKLLVDKSLPLQLTTLLLKPNELVNALNDADIDIAEMQSKVSDVLIAGRELISRLAIDPCFKPNEDLEKNTVSVEVLDLEDIMAFLESYTGNVGGNLKVGDSEVTREELSTFPESEEIHESETDRENSGEVSSESLLLPE